MYPRIFRLFVSSTFSDFIAEREALQKFVFPELEMYCAQRGARFEAVDLRWGITEEAQREHDTMRICLEEIRRCQQLSPRPNFAVLLGDRYGWEPVPARISEDHWQRLMKAASPADQRLIQKNYRLDENAVPPVYCQNECLQAENAQERETSLLQALRRSAKGFPRCSRIPYFASATHQEIVLGALTRRDGQGRALNPERHVNVYVRHLEGLPQSESAKEFIDWDVSTGEVVSGARERLRGLEKQLRRRLGTNVHDLYTTWSSGGVVNEAYLMHFCESFLRHQKALIATELNLPGPIDSHLQREAAHQVFGTSRAEVFAGRKTLLSRIEGYTSFTPKSDGSAVVKGVSSVAPLIILGEGGIGKSALLARAAKESLGPAKTSSAVMLQRYIGSIPGSELLMTLLGELTADIAILYGKPQPPAPENAEMLAEGFKAVLAYADAKRPLILYLDALDQLEKADDAWLLEWLPKKLPAFVRIVTSVRIGSSVEQSARRRYPRSAIINVPPMKRSEGREMLRAWLSDKRAAFFNAGVAPAIGRRLTPQQEKAVLDVFSGSALWLKLAYEEAATWESSDLPRQLPASVPGLIEDFIDHRLIRQKNHPKLFTERALAYLAAGRFGLSESELRRALATDKAVRLEFSAIERTQRKWVDEKQLPPILWSRLYFDLQPYLGLARLDGALLLRWFHREFAEVLKARYLASQEARQVVHGALADTFVQLERELRPDQSNDDALFRATDVSGKQVSAALRRVMEQPWQLAQAGRNSELEALLVDFGFCMGKCAARRSSDLLADITDSQMFILTKLPRRIWFEFLLSIGHVLRLDSEDWPAHRILLQLSLEFPLLQNHHRIKVWSESQAGWVVSQSVTNLTSGCEDFPMVTFVGHSGKISGVFLLPENLLLSWSTRDCDIRIWNVFSGETQLVLRHDANLVDVDVMADGRILSSSKNKLLRVWSLGSQDPIASFRLWGPSWCGVGRFASIDAMRVAYWYSGGKSAIYEIKILCLKTGNELATLPRSLEEGHADYVIGVLSLGGDSILSWSDDQTVRRWDVGRGFCQAVSRDLQAPIVKVETCDSGVIHVHIKSRDFSGETTTLWVLCSNTLISLQDSPQQRLIKSSKNFVSIRVGEFQGAIRWKEDRITLHSLGSIAYGDLQDHHISVESRFARPQRSSPRLTTLKILPNAKIIAGLSDGFLALFDVQTGAVIDRIEGRADCAGSGCLLDENVIAIWSNESADKNLLRIWHPGTRLKMEKAFIRGGRIEGAKRVPGGLLTWGGRSVILWKTTPLREIFRVKHPVTIRFLRRLDAYNQFASCDCEGNIALWSGTDLGNVTWIRTKRCSVKAVRRYKDNLLLVLYEQSGLDLIEGYSLESMSSIGVSQRNLERSPFSQGSVGAQEFPVIQRNFVQLKARDGRVGFWFNRGESIQLIKVVSQGSLIARREGELLLIQSDNLTNRHAGCEIDEYQYSDVISDEDLEDLDFAPPPLSTMQPLSDVFEALRHWVVNGEPAQLDTPDFLGTTWQGGNVFVISAYSRRPEQEVRNYRNRSFAHSERFGLITHFPKAIDLLFKKLRSEVLPHRYMDKDYFYTEVAKSMSVAERLDKNLIMVLSAGIDRAFELIQQMHSNPGN